MQAMTVSYLAVVATAALLFAAEPQTQKNAVMFVDTYAGNHYEPLTKWAHGRDIDPYPMPRTEIYIGDLSIRADGRYVSK